MTTPRLHAVTDDRVLALPDFLDRARALALGPDVAIHVRASRGGRALLELTEALRAVTTPTATCLAVNDRVDVARLADADAVHLPEHGLPTAAVRRSAPGLLVGRSVHTTAAARADRNSDWVFLGPIWATASHPDRPALGPASLRDAGAVAIGGVTPDRATEAIAHGAAGIAAITALWDAPDPAAAARAFLVSFA